MKKLYRKGTVHPSPPIISDHLSFLPAAILTLAAALSPEDKEVLAYLISCSDHSTTKSTNYKSPQRSANLNGTVLNHTASFSCNCFGCYMSYWVRWDSSPNRQLIHEIIDAFEDDLLNKKKIKSKKDRKKNRAVAKTAAVNFSDIRNESPAELTLSKGELSTESGSAEKITGGGDGLEEKGSVRSFMGFVGEKIWGGVTGVWN